MVLERYAFGASRGRERMSRRLSALREPGQGRSAIFRLALVAGATLVASSGGVSAHEPKTGPNGGLQVDAGERHHIELLARGAEVNVFLSDADEKPLPSVGHAGTAILIVGGNPQRISLQAADGSRLTGTATAALPDRPKGAVRITGPNGTSFQAKFD